MGKCVSRYSAAIAYAFDNGIGVGVCIGVGVDVGVEVGVSAGVDVGVRVGVDVGDGVVVGAGAGVEGVLAPACRYCYSPNRNNPLLLSLLL